MRQNEDSSLAKGGWDPRARAEYAGRPAEYLTDILGVEFLTVDQKRLLGEMQTYMRLAAAAANATGKTFLVAAFGVYWMDAVGSFISETTGEPEGAKWILTGPSADNVMNLWREALGHMRRAQQRGFPMGGLYSELSIKWLIRDDWLIEPITPPRSSKEAQQHGAAGRHHKNLLITVDEAAGVDRSRYMALEGIASGASNRIILTFNPTEVASPAKDAYDDPSWFNSRLSAFGHPNVIERREVVGGAISHLTVERRIRRQCDDLGDFIPGENEPDPDFHDFLWRMHPEAGTPEASNMVERANLNEVITVGNTEYTVLGYRDAPIRIYRPDGQFMPQTLGLFPVEGASTLFPTADLDKAVQLWRELQATRPERPPDRVGLDPAEEGGDEPMTAPLWLLDRGVERAADGTLKPRTLYYYGRLRPTPAGMGHVVADGAVMLYGRSPVFVVDAIGVGSGAENALEREHGCKTIRFKGSHGAMGMRGEDDPEFLNRRAAAYWHFSKLLRAGLVALPDDQLLYRQLQATTYDFLRGRLRIIPKDKLIQKLGVSPDRADAVVMAPVEDLDTGTAGRGYFSASGGLKNRKRGFDPVAYYGGRS